MKTSYKLLPQWNDIFYGLMDTDENPEWNSIIDPSSEKHSRRIQQKKNHIAKQARIWNSYPYQTPLQQPHRNHKTKAVNCGRPGCFLCANPRRTMNELTIQEKRFYEADSVDGEFDDTI